MTDITSGLLSKRRLNSNQNMGYGQAAPSGHDAYTLLNTADPTLVLLKTRVTKETLCR